MFFKQISSPSILSYSFDKNEEARWRCRTGMDSIIVAEALLHYPDIIDKRRRR